MKTVILISYTIACALTILLHLVGIGVVFSTDVASDRYAVVNDVVADESKVVLGDEVYYDGLFKNTETLPTKYNIRSWDTGQTLDNVSITYEYTIKYSVKDSRVKRFHKEYDGKEWKIREDARECSSSILKDRISKIDIQTLLENSWTFQGGIDCKNVVEIKVNSVTSNEPIWRPEPR